MDASQKPDISNHRERLEAIFRTYPAGNFCDVCAKAVGAELREAGFGVEIVTVQNEANPAQPNMRPPFIQAKLPDGKSFLLGQNGFHQANRIIAQPNSYYIDPLVYLHFGVELVDERTYFGLFVYTDSMEITGVEFVEGD
jgi:hypothetical protein